MNKDDLRLIEGAADFLSESGWLMHGAELRALVACLEATPDRADPITVEQHDDQFLVTLDGQQGRGPDVASAALEAAKRALGISFRQTGERATPDRADPLDRLERFSHRAESDGKVDAEQLRKAIAELRATPDRADRGNLTECPIEGVHEHAFRGPHRFREWDPDR